MTPEKPAIQLGLDFPEFDVIGLDLPPGRPSFLTRVWLVDSCRFRVGQVRR